MIDREANFSCNIFAINKYNLLCKAVVKWKQGDIMFQMAPCWEGGYCATNSVETAVLKLCPFIWQGDRSVYMLLHKMKEGQMDDATVLTQTKIWGRGIAGNPSPYSFFLRRKPLYEII